MAPTCDVCHDQESRYKCPVCELRYCSLKCYKVHKSTHVAETADSSTSQAPAQLRDRPGTTQRIPKVDFTGFENDAEFQRLLTRYPLLKTQLQTIYGLTLEPGPDEARSWNRQPLPGFTRPAMLVRGGRGRGRGRGDFSQRGGRHQVSTGFSQERERGPWTAAKGDKEALSVIKKMRADEEGGKAAVELSDGMREFIELCHLRFDDETERA